MRTSRSLAAAAASTVLAAALLVGAALPTQAAPPPPWTPVIPGPTFPPRIPGFPLPGPTLRIPLVTIPTCSNMIPATAIRATAVRYPGFGAVPNVAGLHGAQASTLTNVIRARTDAVTCSYGTSGTARVVVTETRITTAQYKIIKSWYDRNRVSATVGGGPIWAGGPTTIHYFVGTSGPSGGATEVASISPNGWWVTVRDVGLIGALPYFQMDAVEQFLALNPLLPR